MSEGEYDKTLRLDRTGDVFVNDQNDAEVIGGHNAVVEELKILLLTIQGEDPFDETHGLRLFEIAGASDAVLEREVRFALQEDDRVVEVVEVDVNSAEANRTRDVDVTVTLTHGETVQFGVEME